MSRLLNPFRDNAQVSQVLGTGKNDSLQNNSSALGSRGHAETNPAEGCAEVSRYAYIRTHRT